MSTGRENKSTAILALTEKGAALAVTLAGRLAGEAGSSNNSNGYTGAGTGMTGMTGNIDVYLPCRLENRLASHKQPAKVCFFANWRESFARVFRNYGYIICIMAAGIVVRTMAPYLDSKLSDPAVVVVDEKGEFAVSLLSGHLGGANELARLAAFKLGGQPVITTATDVNQKMAVDLLAGRLNADFRPVERLKFFNRRLAEGQEVLVTSPLPVKAAAVKGFTWRAWTGGRTGGDLGCVTGCVTGCTDNMAAEPGAGGTAVVVISPYRHDFPDTARGGGAGVMQLLPRNLTVGIGCRRGVSLEDADKAFHHVLDEFKIVPSCVRCLATIDFKGEEAALRLLSEQLKVPLKTVTKQEINALEGTFEPSGWVQKKIGVGGVCEPAARIAAGMGITVVPKQKAGPVTISVAMEKSWWLDWDRETGML